MQIGEVKHVRRGLAVTAKDGLRVRQEFQRQADRVGAIKVNIG
jgi:hypothetical protein